MTRTEPSTRREPRLRCGLALGLALLVAGCGGAPAAPIAPVPSPATSEALRYTRIELGTQRGHAARTTFVLVVEGERAALTETYDRDPRPRTLAQADREPAWQLTATHTYRGTRRVRGDEVELDLRSPDTQPLSLRCAPRPLSIAPPSAGLVSDEAAAGPCAGRRWQPAPGSPSKVLVCGAAGIDLPNPDDTRDADDQLVFSPSPGVEWVDEHDGCAERFGGLRFAR